VIATTHLSDIIGFVHRSPGMINAGMEFDDANFTPLYRLIVGEPGQSHAVEIARRFGMPERVIAFARQMLGNAGSEFAGLLTELRQRRKEFEDLRKNLEVRQLSLDQRSAELDARADEVLQIRKEAAEKGWEDAKELISTTRRRTNALLEELKREKRSEIVDELRRVETDLTQQLKPQDIRSVLLPLKTAKPGDTVHIRSLGCDGAVLSFDVRSGKTRVRAGRMELDVPLAQLAKPLAKGDKGKGKTSSASWKIDVVESEQHELKLIGMRVDAALAELEPFINHASAAGRLRDAVREELGRHPLVESYRPGEPHEGRDGATIVMLRH
jgi:DNA mismatch repair protein MutS2